MLPKTLSHRRRAWYLVDVIDKNIEPPLLLINPLKQGCNLCIVVVIDSHWHGFAAKCCSRNLRCPKRNGRGRRDGRAPSWAQVEAALKHRGVIRALSSRDVELFRDEFADDRGPWGGVLEVLCVESAAPLL